MKLQNELQKVVSDKERRLKVLEDEADLHGVDSAPAYILAEINQLRAELAQLREQLSAASNPAPVVSTESPRWIYGVAGLLIAGAVSVALNLLANGLQQRFFPGQFTDQALWGLAVFAVIGGLIGLYLGGKVTVTPTTASNSVPATTPQPVQLTRFKALFSLGELRGKGISLSDIFLIGSKLKIDTRDDDASHH